MTRPLQCLSGTLAMLALVAAAALLSAWPSYRVLPEGTAVVKLSFSHGAPRACRPMTEDELALEIQSYVAANAAVVEAMGSSDAMELPEDRKKRLRGLGYVGP